MATRKKAEKAGPETKVVEYHAPGVLPDVTREDASIDVELEEIRDREAEANKVDISGSREEPSIDPALVKARDAQMQRETGTDGGKPAKKAPAKKSAPAKSGK